MKLITYLAATFLSLSILTLIATIFGTPKATYEIAITLGVISIAATLIEVRDHLSLAKGNK
jgi:uncharacterized membrane protein HdeD (DUF308 family)